LHTFRQQSGIEASWSIEGDSLPLARDVQNQVLRVMQEALSNIRKHARASHAAIEVRRGADWAFAIRDDGVGFNAGTGSDSLRVGLKIMRERAGVIGAALEVESAAGQGTVVRLTVPGACVPHADAVSEMEVPAS
jgi:two-component system nitrate/nitrite sensor histidine kinase NarX